MISAAEKAYRRTSTYRAARRRAFRRRVVWGAVILLSAACWLWAVKELLR